MEVSALRCGDVTYGKEAPSPTSRDSVREAGGRQNVGGTVNVGKCPECNSPIHANASLAAPPWALTATLDSAYGMRPMGARHSHEEGQLGSKSCSLMQEGSLEDGFFIQKQG